MSHSIWVPLSLVWSFPRKVCRPSEPGAREIEWLLAWVAVPSGKCSCRRFWNLPRECRQQASKKEGFNTTQHNPRPESMQLKHVKLQ
jgi:hypothetical protein